MYSGETIQTLRQKAATLPLDGSVHMLELNGQRYWLKTRGDEKDNLLRRLSTWLAKTKALQFFSVNSVLSSAERIKLEIANTQAMHGKKLPVPEIIFSGDGFFLTPDCGTTLRDNALLPKIDRAIVKQAFDALAQIHQGGCYHGRPALRDIALSKAGVITFVDLEESGLSYKPKLMARDVFLLLTDLKRAPQLTLDDKLAGVEAWADRVGSETSTELYTIYRFMKRLSFLPKLVLKFRYNSTSEKFLDAIDVLDQLFKRGSHQS